MHELVIIDRWQSGRRTGKKSMASQPAADPTTFLESCLWALIEAENDDALSEVSASLYFDETLAQTLHNWRSCS